MMVREHPSEIELFEEVEGELEPERSSEVRAHLDVCAACSASVAELVHAREVLRSSPLLELPAERVSEMVATFPKRERKRRFRLGRLTTLQRVGAAAAAVAAVVIGVTVVTTGNDNTGEPTAASAPPPADTKEPSLQVQAQADASPAPEGGEGAAPFEAAPSAESAAPAEPPAEPAPQTEESQAAPPAEVPAPTKTAAPPAEEAPAAPEAATASLPVASLEGSVADVVKLLEELGFTARALDETTVQVTGATADDVATALQGRPAGAVNVIVQPAQP